MRKRSRISNFWNLIHIETSAEPDLGPRQEKGYFVRYPLSLLADIVAEVVGEWGDGLLLAPVQVCRAPALRPAPFGAAAVTPSPRRGTRLQQSGRLTQRT